MLLGMLLWLLLRVQLRLLVVQGMPLGVLLGLQGMLLGLLWLLRLNGKQNVSSIISAKQIK